MSGILVPGTRDQIEVMSSNGRDLRIHFGTYALTPQQARDLAAELAAEAVYAERLPAIHERHVDLLASCALCRGEAGLQTDRLTYDDPEENDR